MPVLRLIIDPPQSGPLNMAIDEALLESAANSGMATLRLYEWSEATLSLGYFQSAADRQSHAASLACPLVRRASGGGAILHDRELTYSVAVSEKSPAAAESRRLYELCHATLIEVLKELGVTSALFSADRRCEAPPGGGVLQPFLCFQRRTCFDVVSAGAKIAGSAQRRRRGAILQHGSILLSRSEYAPELPGIEQLAGTRISTALLNELWPPRLADCLGYALMPGRLVAGEISSSQALCRERFAAEDWLYRR